MEKIEDNKIPLQLRLGSMLLDHFAMSLLLVPPLILIGIIVSRDQSSNMNPIETISFYSFMIIYLNKDFFYGKSIAKRYMGLVVIDKSTEQPASELKCFIRNLTMPFWPIEVLVTLFSPKRRLGDLLANTIIEQSAKKESLSIWEDIKNYNFSKISIWTLFGGAIYGVFLWWILP